jgi:sterol desaturase/sphingolipid hydroxylase (fatty acid hydroxylase superfamily)
MIDFPALPGTGDGEPLHGGGDEVGRAVIVAGLAGYLAVLAAGWWTAQTLLPDTIPLCLAGRTLSVGAVHERLNNIALIFVLLPLALWVECMVVGWRRSSARQILLDRTPSVKSDLAVFILGQGYVIDILGRLMMLGASAISGGWIHDWLKAQTGFAVDPSGLPLALQITVFFFVYTFFDYWTHRMDHTPVLWPIHRYHHSARDFAVVTSTRTHAVHFTALFMVNLPLAILGAPPEVMLYVNVLVVSIGFLIHSKIESDWGVFGRWVIQSPNGHRLHHKLDMSYPTGHFGMAPIWDRLFGTWDEKNGAAVEIGVDTPYRHGWFVFADLFRDYGHLWLGLIGRRNDGPDAAGLNFERRHPR